VFKLTAGPVPGQGMQVRHRAEEGSGSVECDRPDRAPPRACIIRWRGRRIFKQKER
jgi:hypothetical protein